jgi:hypothetical protein
LIAGHGDQDRSYALEQTVARRPGDRCCLGSSNAVVHADLPLHLRAAIDLVAQRSAGQDHRLPARAIGHPRLVAELRTYAPADERDRSLVALGADQRDLRAAVETDAPGRVVTLASGPLERALRRLRAVPFDLPSDLSPAAWRALGYAPATAAGVQGLGWLVWATAERVARRFGRPDLADRCRIAALRTLVTNGVVPRLAAVHVRTYERWA